MEPPRCRSACLTPGGAERLDSEQSGTNVNGSGGTIERFCWYLSARANSRSPALANSRPSPLLWDVASAVLAASY
jgi:hypothetical protein